MTGSAIVASLLLFVGAWLPARGQITNTCRYCSTAAQTCQLQPLCKAYTQTMPSIEVPSSSMLESDELVSHIHCHISHCVVDDCNTCAELLSNCTELTACNTILTETLAGRDITAEDLENQEFGALSLCRMNNCIEDNEYSCLDCEEEELACIDSESCIAALKEQKQLSVPSEAMLEDEDFVNLFSCEIKASCHAQLPCQDCADSYINCMSDSTCNEILTKHLSAEAAIDINEAANTLFSTMLTCNQEKCDTQPGPSSGTAQDGVISASGSYYKISGSFSFFVSGSGMAEEAPNGTTALPPSSGAASAKNISTAVLFAIISTFWIV